MFYLENTVHLQNFLNSYCIYLITTNKLCAHSIYVQHIYIYFTVFIIYINNYIYIATVLMKASWHRIEPKRIRFSRAF